MNNRRSFLTFFLTLALVFGALIGASVLRHADASPALNPTNVGGQGSEITLVAPGVHSGSGAGDWRCDEGQFTDFTTEVRVVGTMIGTNPTDSLVIQHSIDQGTSVAGTVNTFAGYNATTIPAVATDMRVNDVVIANTPIAYGRCWRVAWTAGGTGSPGMSFSVVQYRH
jgi:ABC-type transport system substrate-binding protein